MKKMIKKKKSNTKIENQTKLNQTPNDITKLIKIIIMKRIKK
jgi:hypothetical protein